MPVRVCVCVCVCVWVVWVCVGMLVCRCVGVCRYRIARMTVRKVFVDLLWL